MPLSATAALPASERGPVLFFALRRFAWICSLLIIFLVFFWVRNTCCPLSLAPAPQGGGGQKGAAQRSRPRSFPRRNRTVALANTRRGARCGLALASRQTNTGAALKQRRLM